MNKLYESLLIVKHFGWFETLDEKSQTAFNFLFEKSKSLTNEELTKADHDVINYVNQLLEDKLGTNKSNSSN